jgi:hypothetical protein
MSIEYGLLFKFVRRVDDNTISLLEVTPGILMKSAVRSVFSVLRFSRS